MTHYISFPNIFDKVFTVNQTIFGIHWYAIIIATGFLIAAIYAMTRAKQFNTNADTVADILIFALPAAIIGARLYYVVNSWEYFSQNLSKIVAIWEGGLAIYGAVIAALIVVVIYGKIKKLDILSFMDLGALGLLIGQFIGRWGNFVNAEAFGTQTDSFFGMVIRKNILETGTPVHPTFLYESIWNLLGFVMLHFYSKKRKFKGEIFLLYTAWYGLGRGFIEGLRTDSLFIGDTTIRISQALGWGSCVVAVLILAYLYITKKYSPVDHAQIALDMAEKTLKNEIVITSEPTDSEIIDMLTGETQIDSIDEADVDEADAQSVAETQDDNISEPENTTNSDEETAEEEESTI